MQKLSKMHLQVRSFSKARKQAKEAVEAFHTMGCEREEAATKLEAMVNVLAVYGDHEGALETAKTALRSYQSTGDERNEGLALLVVGTIHNMMGNEEIALSTLREAQELMRDAGEQKGGSQI